MKVEEVRKNAAPWFLLLVLALALSTSPQLMHACFRGDTLPDATPFLGTR